MPDVARPQWALCLGGASCVWDDTDALHRILGSDWPGLVIAANDIGCHWPHDLHHWVSLHPNKFLNWKALRAFLQEGARAGEPELWSRQRVPYVTWGKRPTWDADLPLLDHILDPWPGGSSGMFAVQVALHLECTRVVLCGVPMTATAHFSESQERFTASWGSADAHWGTWIRLKDRMGRVRSMSGRTRELLGAPTLDWFMED